MPGAIAVRRAHADDLPLLVALEARSFPHPWSADLIAPYLASEAYAAWIAEEGLRACGYVLATVVSDEAEVDRMGVDPVDRRRGVGRLLLARCLEHVARRDVRSVWLEVAASNVAATRLYEQAGFVAVRRRRGYYARQTTDTLAPARPDSSALDDAIIMRLDLPQSRPSRSAGRIDSHTLT